MKRIIHCSFIALLMAGCLSLQSCVRQDFDSPPDNSTYDPALPVTHTIADIQALPSGEMITEDMVISGIVNMDDRSGNYYKKIVIQDETGGMEILLDQNNLYNDYPVGRKVYVRLKGLYKGDYNLNPQIGYTPDETGSLSNIPFTLIDQHMVKANYPHTLTPVEVTLTDLKSPNAAAHLINKLVVISKVEFSSEALGLTYASPASISSATNRNIKDCDDNMITLRTSGYAQFQPVELPGGNGTITAIYTRFGSTPQLYIRNTEDVIFNNERCDGSSPSTEVLLNDGFDNLDNWNPVSVSGDQVWSIASFGNPKPCVVMSGFADGTNYVNEDWLVSRPINLSGYSMVTLTFESAENYSGNPLECLISTDYSGSGDPNAATWTVLPATYDSSAGFTFTPSGNIDLSSYAGGNVYIAFKYTSTSGASKTWEIDNVKIIAE